MAKEAIYFFEDYEKISDTLMYFDRTHILKFNVSLATKDKEGHRWFFHKESVYNNDKYTDPNRDLVSIRRNMTFYFSIDDTEDYKRGILIGIQDKPFLLQLMDNVISWFTTNPIFDIKEGSYHILGEYEPQAYIFNGGKSLEFYPVVLDYGAGQTDCGVRLCINGHETFIDLDFKRFMIFYTILKETDMYGTACSILAYMMASPGGINSTKVSNYGQGSGGNSFFDKL